MDALGGIRFGSEIAAAARRQGLDPRLLAAVAAQETGGPGSSSGRNVIGDGGHGRGVFQIDDRTWAFAKTPAAMNPAANAGAAATILRDDLDRYGGNVRAALSAYNGGTATAIGTPTTWADGATLGYADSVLRHYAQLGGDPSALVADNRTASAASSGLAGLAGSTPVASSGYATGYAPPVVQADSQSPFTAPVSWANEMSSTGPAGGKEAADADSLVAASIDSTDGVFDDRDDA